MGIGIVMGTREDFTLAPVHAHINLLGWVTLALYGLYHRGVARARNALAWVQVSAAASRGSGHGGRPRHLAGRPAPPLFAPLDHRSARCSPSLGMALFLAILVADLRRIRCPYRASRLRTA